MKITAIKQQVNLKGRYSIFIDNSYAFSLSGTALLESKLAPRQVLTPADVKRYKQLSQDDKTYAHALRYAAARLRSAWELQGYLQRKKIPPELSQGILDRLVELGFVNDEEFARSWVENRRLLKPISTRKLQQELKLKRISSDIIAEVLGANASASQEADQRPLRYLIERKRRQTRYQDDLKLMQYLLRQGFNYDDVKSAMRETPNE